MLEDGAGNVYTSVEAWLELLRSVESLRQQPPMHALRGRLPQGHHFVEQVPELIDALAAKLNIPLQRLDKSEKSLEVLDQAIQHRGQAECLEADTFAPLVAYVGEVIRQAVNGAWEMRLANSVGVGEIIVKKVNGHWEEADLTQGSEQEPEIWEPWIIDPQGHGYQPYIHVYGELCEAVECCIYGSVSGQLSSHLLFEA